MKKQSILINSSALTIAKALKFLTPLIILPRLTSALGIEYIGIIAVAEAIIAYFIVVSDYGFGLTATRHVARHHDDIAALSRLVTTIMCIKAVIALAGAIILLFIVIFFDLNLEISQVTLLLYLMVIGNVLYFPWFFQGLEDSRPLILGQLLSSLVIVAGIYLFVHTAHDVLYVPILYGIGAVANGTISAYFIWRLIGFPRQRITLGMIRTQLVDGFPVFLSMLSVNAYSNVNIFFLSFFANNAVVGQYKVAMTIAVAAADCLAPLAMSVYARLLREFETSVQRYLYLFKKVAIRVIPLYFFASIIILLSAPYIMDTLKTPADSLDIDILRWLSIYPVIQGLCAYGTIHILVMRYNVYYLKVSVYVALLSIPMSFVLTKYHGIYGSVWAYLLSAIIVAKMYWMLFWKDRGLFRFN